jgi:hypothetical protein
MVGWGFLRGFPLKLPLFRQSLCIVCGEKRVLEGLPLKLPLFR